MILSKPEIIKNINNGNIVADGVYPEQLAEHSIDVSLNKNLWVSSKAGWKLIDITEGAYFYSGDFCLPIVDEWVGTRSGSGICCEFKLKSTAARQGIDHSLAGFVEEGYFSRLCLEFSFHRPVKLTAGDLIGQFVFHKLSSAGEDYTAKKSYQKTSDLEELKTNWRPEMVLPKSIKNKYEL